MLTWEQRRPHCYWTLQRTQQRQGIYVWGFNSLWGRQWPKDKSLQSQAIGSIIKEAATAASFPS